MILGMTATQTQRSMYSDGRPMSNTHFATIQNTDNENFYNLFYLSSDTIITCSNGYQCIQYLENPSYSGDFNIIKLKWNEITLDNTTTYELIGRYFTILSAVQAYNKSFSNDFSLNNYIRINIDINETVPYVFIRSDIKLIYRILLDKTFCYSNSFTPLIGPGRITKTQVQLGSDTREYGITCDYTPTHIDNHSNNYFNIVKELSGSYSYDSIYGVRPNLIVDGDNSYVTFYIPKI